MVGQVVTRQIDRSMLRKLGALSQIFDDNIQVG